MTQLSSNIQQLLHPDLMSKEEIIDILKMRCIKISDIEHLDRSELLNVYSRIVIPLEQRPPRHSATKNGTTNGVNSPRNEPTSIPVNRKIRVNSTFNNNESNDYDKGKKILRMSEDVSSVNLKRSISNENDQPEVPSKKGRQKITWP